MAINGCTIDGFTLHGFKCRDKFASLVPILHPPVTPGTGSVGWHQQAAQQRWTQPEVPKHIHTELERITVTATFQALFGSATQEITPRLDLVTVTDIHVNPVSVSVNIENLKVNQDAKSIDK